MFRSILTNQKLYTSIISSTTSSSSSSSLTLITPYIYRTLASTTPASATSSSSSSSLPNTTVVEDDVFYPGPSTYAMKPSRSPAKKLEALKLRVQKIQEGLANQNKVIKDYQKQKPVRPLKQGLLQYIKKNAWEKD